MPWAVVSFLLAVILGLVLRSAFILELPEWIQFRHVLHAHSHVAMLGWIYSAFFVLIVYWFNLPGKSYKWLFWITQVSILGMLITFCLQGYGVFSIIFNSLHIILSYIFTYKVFQDLKRAPKSPSLLLLKCGFFFLLISTLSPWALGIIMNTPLRGSPIYYGTIQFYLHFQFNGWMFFTALAVFFKFLESKNFSISNAVFKKFYWLLIVSCVLTFALSISWSTPYKVIFWTNSLGVILQIVALYYLYEIFKALQNEIKSHVGKWSYRLFLIAFWSFCLKIIVQGLVAIPDLAIISYTIRNFVVGFIHLVMLGVLSLFIFGIYSEQNNRICPRNAIKGFRLFIFGFLATEFLLFFQGFLLWIQKGFIPYYHHLITGMSVFMFIGVAFYLLSVSRISTKDRIS